MKRILLILSLFLLVGYIAFSAIAMTDRHEDVRLCQGVDLNIVDSLHFDLIDEDMILSLLQEHSVDPIGMPLDAINVETIENILVTHPLVGSAQCYKTGGNRIRINLSSKVPLVRVLNNRGQDFYVDSHGEILTQHSLAVQLPVATGYIDRRFAADDQIGRAHV